MLCLSDVEKGERTVSFQPLAHVQFCFMIGFSLSTLKYSSSLEGKKRSFILEPDGSNCGLKQTQVVPKDAFQYRNDHTKFPWSQNACSIFCL